MTDEQARLDHLKRRFDFDAWAGRNRLEWDLHVWKFRFRGDELPGFELLRVDRSVPDKERPAPPLLQCRPAHRETVAEREEAADWPVQVKSFWRSRDCAEALLNVDVHECASRAAAHVFLLRILGTFESVHLARCDDPDVGDVAFAMPGMTMIASARGNIVTVMRNATRVAIKVDAVTKVFDRLLVASADDRGETATSQRSYQDQLPPPASGEPAPLYYKVTSTTGTLVRRAGNLVLFTPDGVSPQPVDVIEVYPGDRASRQYKVTLDSRR
jgi:hypothetical protein